MATLRLAARVLVFDAEDRLLLFQLHNGVSGNTWWATPGGGVEKGEGMKETALRELREETGHEASELSGPVWDQDHWFRSGPDLIHQRERFFLARVASAVIDRAGMDVLEGDTIVGHRWWTLPEVFTSLEKIYPEGLAAVGRALVNGQPPFTGDLGRVIDVNGSRQVGEARRLFREYEAAIGLDLAFQGFDAELAGLPGVYAPPGGALLLARVGREAVGTAALRPFEGRTAELKRVYVRDGFRGRDLGRRLAGRCIGHAVAAGYDRVRLDTLPAMTPAINLYEALGFRRIKPYRDNPVDGAVFMELSL